MSMLDKLKGLLKGHEDQAEKGVDKAGDYVDERTQGKYQSQVDTAQDKLKEQFRDDRPPQ
ncbi:antitoxin [Kitasatospora sp. NPDC028055]|uniref:antitoxin n=1 Tax=unclassified Kitasatospora TaxID=2633591 RepID=UPI0033C6DEBA